MIKKILLTYHKPVRTRIMKKRFIDEVSQASKLAKEPKVGIRYNTESKELIVAGCHALALQIDEIALKWFNGEVKAHSSMNYQKENYTTRYKFKMTCTRKDFARGQRRCLREKFKKQDRKWKVEFNANLGRTIN